MAKKKLVRKTHVVPFVNVGTDSAPDWRRIEKSKTFTLSTNPQVKTYDYISSDIPEEEITGYQPSLAQSLTMWKNSDDYEEFFGMLFKLPTGENAHRDVMVAFYQEKGKNGGKCERIAVSRIERFVRFGRKFVGIGAERLRQTQIGFRQAAQESTDLLTREGGKHRLSVHAKRRQGRKTIFVGHLRPNPLQRIELGQTLLIVATRQLTPLALILSHCTAGKQQSGTAK